MATARLRQTFHYPEDDSGDEDAYRGLDEEGKARNTSSGCQILICLEEQEDLIKEIKNEDRNRNEFYKVFVNSSMKWDGTGQLLCPNSELS